MSSQDQGSSPEPEFLEALNIQHQGEFAGGPAHESQEQLVELNQEQVELSGHQGIAQLQQGIIEIVRDMNDFTEELTQEENQQYRNSIEQLQSLVESHKQRQTMSVDGFSSVRAALSNIEQFEILINQTAINQLQPGEFQDLRTQVENRLNQPDLAQMNLQQQPEEDTEQRQTLFYNVLPAEDFIFSARNYNLFHNNITNDLNNIVIQQELVIQQEQLPDQEMTF